MHVFRVLKSQLHHYINAIKLLSANLSNSENRITTFELSKIIKDIGISPCPEPIQLEKFVESLDREGKGHIDLNVMITFCLRGIVQSERKRADFEAKSELNKCLAKLFVYLETF